MEYNTLMENNVANNIIMFPRPNRQTNGLIPPATIEEVEDSVVTMKQIHVQEALEHVVPKLFENLAILGFLPDDETLFIKDGALIVESVRAFLYKLYDIDHPLQIISDNIFVECSDTGGLEVSDRVKIVITPNDEHH
jgi:hypothetical protein